MTRAWLFIVAPLALLACATEEETVANRFDRTNAEIENKARELESEVENQVRAIEAEKQNEIDAIANAQANVAMPAETNDTAADVALANRAR